jgi:hypothetical protein
LDLSSFLGVSYEELRVSAIRGKVSVFNVCSKAVGFLIMKNRKFSCKDFVCYFDIWSSGGPNWQHEEFAWYKEQENEWTFGPRQRSHEIKADESGSRQKSLSSSTPRKVFPSAFFLSTTI